MDDYAVSRAGFVLASLWIDNEFLTEDALDDLYFVVNKIYEDWFSDASNDK